MTEVKLRVLIVSRMGAYQKAIQAMCASIPRIAEVETANGIQQAVDAVKRKFPDVVIFASNLVERQVCDLIDDLKSHPQPPFCIALIESEFNPCFDHYLDANQVVSSRTFANRLPEILDEVFA